MIDITTSPREQKIRKPYWRRPILWCIAGVVIFLAVQLFKDKRSIAVIRCSDSISIEVFKPTSWELSIPLYYRIQDANDVSEFEYLGNTVTEKYPLQFDCLRAKNGMIAIVETSNPDVVVILYNPTTKSTWPIVTNEYELGIEKGRKMLKEFLEKSSAKNLVLSADVSGKRSVKIRR